MSNLIVLAGIPGSGKSTWARQFLDLKYRIISSDEIRKGLAGSLRTAHSEGIKPWDEFYRQIEVALNHSVDVVADATFLTRRHRQEALTVGQRCFAKTHLIVFKNLLQAIERNAARDEDDRVPKEVMDDMTTLYYNTLHDIDAEPWNSVTKVESFQ